jgi:hypothetical protein
MRASWFEDATGFKEPKSFPAVRASFVPGAVEPSPAFTPPGVQGPAHVLRTRDGRALHVGPFEDPPVAELRARVVAQAAATAPRYGPSFKNVVGESFSLHTSEAGAGAVFMVASQFNCLEMVGPDVRPEDGVTRYYQDHTQGPACALACPAATVWRNYFWAGRGQAGGSQAQLDTARGAAEVVGNARADYWRMSNGYLMPGRSSGIAELGERLRADAALTDRTRDAFRCGIHWEAETAPASGTHRAPHRLTQVFCSAVPMAYAKGVKVDAWAPIARLALEAAYEATLLAGGALALHRGKRVTVFLSCIGGGAFGNPSLWVHTALERALGIAARLQLPIDVRLVHYGSFAGGGKFGALEREAEPTSAM